MRRLLLRTSCTVALLLSAAAATPAAAEAPRVLLWGFVRGNEAQPELDRLVRQDLEENGLSAVEILGPTVGRSCQAERTAALLRRSCPKLEPSAAAGRSIRILGGRIDPLQRPASRARLFLHDLETGKTAWHDTYCQSCPQASLLTKGAQALLQSPDWSAVPGPRPSYCGGADGNVTARPPAEACTPWPELDCDDGPGAQSAVAAGPSSGAPHIDPGTAKIVKGALWGMFAASAATGLTLTILNGTSVADMPGRSNTLGDAAWTGLGLAAASLAIAIPVHLRVSRAEKPATPNSTTPAAQLKCPQ